MLSYIVSSSFAIIIERYKNLHADVILPEYWLNCWKVQPVHNLNKCKCTTDISWNSLKKTWLHPWILNFNSIWVDVCLTWIHCSRHPAKSLVSLIRNDCFLQLEMKSSLQHQHEMIVELTFVWKENARQFREETSQIIHLEEAQDTRLLIRYFHLNKCGSTKCFRKN